MHKLQIVLFFLMICATAQMSAAAANSQGNRTAGELEAATVVWAEEQDRVYELFFRSYTNGQWSRTKQITDDEDIDYLPTLAFDGKGDTWVVWSSSDNSEVSLNYAVLRNGVVKSGPFRIATGMRSNIGADLGYDWKRKRMLLVWAGSDGQPDDIFLSTSTGGEWSEPRRIHSENNRADYLPKINIDQNGQVTVEWKATLADGPFLFSKELTSTGIFRKKEGREERLKRQTTQRHVNKCLSDLPYELTVLDKSAVIFKCAGEKKGVQVKFPSSYFKK